MLNQSQRSSTTFHRSAVIPAVLLACSAAVAEEEGERAFTRSTADSVVEWGPCPEFMPEGCGLAVLHGEPAEENTDVVFRLAGNTSAERHWHHSAERMVLVSGELHVHYDGQEPVVMTPGTYAYGPAELPHTADCRSSEACILFIAFEAPVDALPGAPE